MIVKDHWRSQTEWLRESLETAGEDAAEWAAKEPDIRDYAMTQAFAMGIVTGVATAALDLLDVIMAAADSQEEEPAEETMRVIAAQSPEEARAAMRRLLDSHRPEPK